MQDEKSFVFLAVLSGRPIGMIVASFVQRLPIYRDRDSLAIGDTVVHSEHRRKGIFRELLCHVEEKAKAGGAKMMEIAVDLDNPARLAYENSGFSVRQEKMVKWME